MKRTRLNLFLLTLGTGLWIPLVMALAAPATAVIKVVPSSGSQSVGAAFAVDFKLDTGGQAVGGVLVDVTYSTNLGFVSADVAGSVFDFEVIAPTPVNNRFQFVRVRLDDGFNGSDGQLIKITFRPTAAGTGAITISTIVSEVIAFSDSSNILKDVINGSFTLTLASAGDGGSTGGGGGGGGSGEGGGRGGGGGGGIYIPQTFLSGGGLTTAIPVCPTKNLYYGLLNPAPAIASATNLEVINLQKALNLAGVYPQNFTDGNFSAVTRQAVIDFQKKHNIQPALGYLGPLTRAKLQGLGYCSPPVLTLPIQSATRSSYCFNANLRLGMRGNPDVVNLQKALNLAGVYPQNIVSGNFLYFTRLAVIAFQKLHNIEPAVGFVGSLTRAKINQIYCR